MFAELFVFLATVFVLILIDKTSFVSAQILLSLLSYRCTKNIIQNSASAEYELEDSEVNLGNAYIRRLARFCHRILFAISWLDIVVSLRNRIYAIKNERNPVSVQNAYNISVTSEEPSCTLPSNPRHCGNLPSFNSEVKTIVDRIMREYVKSWYHGKVSQDKEFINDVNFVIKDTLVAFGSGISKLHRKQLLYHVVQVYVHFFFHFKEAMIKSHGTGSLPAASTMMKKNVVDNFTMRHWAMKDRVTEWCYLQSIMSILLDSFGPVQLLSCSVLHTVVVEILTQNIMYPLINVLTAPDRLNEWLGKLAQNVLKIDCETLLVKSMPNEINIETHNEDLEKSAVTTCKDLQDGNFVQPKILFLDASDELLHDGSSSGEGSNISSSSKRHVALGNLSNESRESFESDSHSRACYGCSLGMSCQSDNSVTNSSDDLPPSAFRVRSSTNTSLRKPKYLTDEQNSRYLDVMQLRRTKSADYIQKMRRRGTAIHMTASFRSTKLSRLNDETIELKSKVPSSLDIEVAEEAIENEIPAIFTDIRIIGTELQDSCHSPYTLYCIQYKGLFQEITDDDSHSLVLVREVVNIKRRFREFRALQSRLESNPVLKLHLKGIKVPSKWLTTPFTNLDKRTIAMRRSFLELYLQELSKRDVISRSSELQEFLAYGGDASIAFVKKHDSTVQRIDKVIARSMKEAFDVFLTALPIPVTDFGNGTEPGPLCLEVPPEESVSESKFEVHLMDFAKRDSEMLDYVRCYCNYIDRSSSNESLSDELAKPDIAKSSFRCHAAMAYGLNDCIGCQCFGTISFKDSVRKDGLLTQEMFDLLLEALQGSSNSISRLTHLLKFLPVSVIDKYLGKRLRDITEAQCALLLHTFHKSMWPDEKLQPKSIQNSNIATAFCNALKKHVKEMTENSWFRKMGWASGLLEDNIDDVCSAIVMFFESIQHRALNRCLLFYAFDVLIENLCSKELKTA